MDTKSEYLQGFIDGLSCFAWWKDGVQYVGTTGKTLKEAIDEAIAGKAWNMRFVSHKATFDIQDLVNIFEATEKGEVYAVGYHLHDGLRAIGEALGGEAGAAEFFRAVLHAEKPEKEIKHEHEGKAGGGDQECDSG